MTIVGEKDLLVHDVFRDILLRLPDDGEHRAAAPSGRWRAPRSARGAGSSSPAGGI